MAYRLQECPLCGGRDLKPLLRARDFHYGNPGEFTQAQCAQCKLAFLDPMYDAAELASFYPKTYYAFADHFPVKNPVYTFKEKVWRFAGRREPETKDPKF